MPRRKGRVRTEGGEERLDNDDDDRNKDDECNDSSFSKKKAEDGEQEQQGCVEERQLSRLQRDTERERSCEKEAEAEADEVFVHGLDRKGVGVPGREEISDGRYIAKITPGCH